MHKNLWRNNLQEKSEPPLLNASFAAKMLCTDKGGSLVRIRRTRDAQRARALAATQAQSQVQLVSQPVPQTRVSFLPRSVDGGAALKSLRGEAPSEPHKVVPRFSPPLAFITVLDGEPAATLATLAAADGAEAVGFLSGVMPALFLALLSFSLGFLSARGGEHAASSAVPGDLSSGSTNRPSSAAPKVAPLALAPAAPAVLPTAALELADGGRGGAAAAVKKGSRRGGSDLGGRAPPLAPLAPPVPSPAEHAALLARAVAAEAGLASQMDALNELKGMLSLAAEDLDEKTEETALLREILAEKDTQLAALEAALEHAAQGLRSRLGA